MAIRAASLLLIGGVALAAQNAPPPLITIQVRALDSHGDPVTDLRTSDFRIADDGKPQAPAFSRFLNTVGLRTPLAPNQFSNRTDNSTAHSTIILFDLLNANLNQRGRSWNEIVQALQRLESGDHFYLYLLTKDASLYPIHAVPDEAPWTKEVEPLLNRAMSVVNRLEPQELLVDVNARVQATFRALKQLAGQIEPLPGRKSLVWVSQGVPISDVGLDEQIRDNTPFVRQFAEELNSHNIPVYAVDQTTAGISHLGSRDTLEEISGLTGGRWYGSDATGLAITQAVNDARATYQIGFYPPAKNWDNKSHKLRVTSVRKGVLVLAREDYETGPTDLTRQENFENAVLAPFDDPAIGLTVTVSPSPETPQATRFLINIDLADLLLEPSASIELAFVDDDGSGKADAPEKTSFTIAPSKDGVVLTKDRVLPSTVQKVRIVVMDTRTDTVGSLTVKTRPLGQP